MTQSRVCQNAWPQRIDTTLCPVPIEWLLATRNVYSNQRKAEAVKTLRPFTWDQPLASLRSSVETPLVPVCKMSVPRHEPVRGCLLGPPLVRRSGARLRLWRWLPRDLRRGLPALRGRGGIPAASLCSPGPSIINSLVTLPIDKADASRKLSTSSRGTNNGPARPPLPPAVLLPNIPPSNACSAAMSSFKLITLTVDPRWSSTGDNLLSLLLLWLLPVAHWLEGGALTGRFLRRPALPEVPSLLCMCEAHSRSDGCSGF